LQSHSDSRLAGSRAARQGTGGSCPVALRPFHGSALPPAGRGRNGLAP
jgi:hypothetical protein